MDYLIMHNTCSGKEIRYIGTAESMVRRSSTLFYHKCKKRDMFSIDISSMILQGGLPSKGIASQVKFLIFRFNMEAQDFYNLYQITPTHIKFH